MGPAQQTVFIIHTANVGIDTMTELFEELAPDVTVRHIIDTGLLKEVLAHSGPTAGVRQRLCSYAMLAESAGADLIMNQCSSVSEVADTMASLVSVPLIKVDQEMAEVACKMGQQVGVVATLPTTLGPTARLIERVAQELEVEVDVTRRLCEGAFDLLISGDTKGHNAMVIGAIRELARSVDVVVCAQGSMAALLPDLGDVGVPVLTSPRLGVERAVRILRSL